MSRAYYNENDPFAAAWLRELIKAGLIADGEVDDRSIADVTAADVRGFTQSHFFAGIGGWSYALRLAGWPDERAVWTGSCPCQPWSVAGGGQGTNDPRHLWPTWFRLIRELRPQVLFGEQVDSDDGYYWLDLVCAQMEGEDYAIAPVGLPAAGCGAPELRHRIWFVAHTAGAGSRTTGAHRKISSRRRAQPGRKNVRMVSGLANADRPLSEYEQLQRSRRLMQPATNPLTGFWASCEWLRCDDGKTRPVEPGTFPLAHGLPARVGRLRGYGNAIVPQAAQVFIEAYMSAEHRPAPPRTP